MENLSETVSLDMEETNDLAFRVSVEGASAPARVRLVCESADVAYMFKGKVISDDVIQFTIPQMKGRLEEGSYDARVEVFVENRYFAPVEFQLEFKKSVKVFAEAVKVNRTETQRIMKVSASLVEAPISKVQNKTARPLEETSERVNKREKAAHEQHKSSSFNSKLIDEATSIRDLVRGILSSAQERKP
jgi:hypothetical protein